MPDAPPTTSSQPYNDLWRLYFDDRISVSCRDRGTFNVWTAGRTGPVVLCLHGGGYSGLTFALAAARLKSTCRVIAPDLRGHGLTTTIDDSDLSAATAAADVVAIWHAALSTRQDNDDNILASSGDAPATCLLGHSMGGALAVHAAALSDSIPTLAGVIVIDVVEGTALASLRHMTAVLARRPRSFVDVEAAIDWAISSGASRNREAALISVPSMLMKRACSRSLLPEEALGMTNGKPPLPRAALNAGGALEAIREDESNTASAGGVAGGNVWKNSCTAGEERVAATRNAEGNAEWVWRASLEESFPYWEGWYKGLSSTFLSLKVPKMLILAGTDRLDRELTIGQMQGRFQLVLLPKAGHAVHEDEAEAVSNAVEGFLKRFRVGSSILTTLLPPNRKK